MHTKPEIKSIELNKSEYHKVQNLISFRPIEIMIVSFAGLALHLMWKQNYSYIVIIEWNMDLAELQTLCCRGVQNCWKEGLRPP